MPKKVILVTVTRNLDWLKCPVFTVTCCPDAHGPVWLSGDTRKTVCDRLRAYLRPKGITAKRLKFKKTWDLSVKK